MYQLTFNDGKNMFAGYKHCQPNCSAPPTQPPVTTQGSMLFHNLLFKINIIYKLLIFNKQIFVLAPGNSDCL